MKALVFRGRNNVQVEQVPDPVIEDPRDIIVKVTSTAICGSDLHMYDGFIPTVEHGDILGHEFMGEVVETGSEVMHVKKGDRVLVPFNLACGECWFCKQELYSLCDVSNRNKEIGDKVFGHSPSGLFGYSHMLGGYAGGQAELVRVPFANFGAFKVPDELPDEKVLFLTDIFPTGYMAAEQANITLGDTVAIWGAGPVGQFALRSALMLGSGRVIVIDTVPERLAMAKEAGAEVLNYSEQTNITELLNEMTKGRGPDAVIDAVGMEAHSAGVLGSVTEFYDRAKQLVMLESDRVIALRQMIYACRKGGTVSIPGVYGGLADKFPIGILMNKGLHVHTGQTHTHKYIPMLMEKVQKGEIDPSFVITHWLSLDEAPHAYDIFRKKEDGCIKVVLKP